ncbi:GTPase [Mycena amicta]|nr:GTPase [Mycena amicta]
MPRKKITNTTKLKAARKLKRAVKRGDVDAPPPPSRRQTKHRSTHRAPPVSEAVQSARKLQSTFINLPPEFLEQTQLLASRLPLLRPIPSALQLLPVFDSELTCPRRPKWNFSMSKEEVEKNEEGIFRKWLSQTDEAIQQWQDQPSRYVRSCDEGAMPRSTTVFERNVEVWRQLWRVTEISQILLVLLDSRAPMLHFPPSLQAYLNDRNVILVLTKVDISGPERAEAWTKYLNARYPTFKVVQVEAYVEKEATSFHQGHRQHRPHMPETFRSRLVQAIREEHAAMLEPPEAIKANPARLEKWKPRIKREIDWDRVLNAEGEKVGSVIGGPAAPHEDDSSEEEPQFLTIGLIGQPNVGKSSLLNALFGSSKVSASKTPGKTKHFQTLFFTPDVRLVDCPGLVMPNLIPLEMQVLAGILPISRLAAVPFCTHYAAQLLPLEKIFRIPQPEPPQVVDKRTWREGERPAANDPQERPWTAMDILLGYAETKGWLTAKGGRPDVHRAGNSILRALAEGRVQWAFWPPDANEGAENAEGEGIWLQSSADDSMISDEESEDEPVEVAESGDSGDLSDEQAQSESSEDDAPLQGAGRFAALQAAVVDEKESEEEGSEASASVKSD